MVIIQGSPMKSPISELDESDTNSGANILTVSFRIKTLDWK